MTYGSGLVVETSVSVDETGWNSFVAGSTTNGVFQTTFYGDRLVELFGWERVFITVTDSSTSSVIGSLAAYFVPTEPGGSFVRKAMNKLKGKQTRLQWFGQPTISPDVESSKITSVLLSRVEDLCAERSLKGVVSSEISSTVEVPKRWEETPWATFYVDISLPEDELWMSLGRTARKAVRKSEKQGISVRQIDDIEELEEYYSYAEGVRAETGQSLLGFEDFETMWRHLSGRGIFETFVAEIDGRRAAGLSVWGLGDVITELGAFVPQWSKDAGLNAGDAIKWKIMQWGSAQGLKTFDLAGFNPNPADDKARMIERFKAKWGGTRVDYNYVSWGT